MHILMFEIYWVSISKNLATQLSIQNMNNMEEKNMCLLYLSLSKTPRYHKITFWIFPNCFLGIFLSDNLNYTYLPPIDNPTPTFQQIQIPSLTFNTHWEWELWRWTTIATINWAQIGARSQKAMIKMQCKCQECKRQIWTSPKIHPHIQCRIEIIGEWPPSKIARQISGNSANGFTIPPHSLHSNLKPLSKH